MDQPMPSALTPGRIAGRPTALPSPLDARSAAVLLSQNKMIYDFGPYADRFFSIFGGQFIVANSVWLLIIMTLCFAFVLNATQWGRHLYAIGGNEQAAQLTGVPVVRVKMQAYIFCSLCAAVSSIMLLGWQGSAINALGTGYELRVIASTVIGGANLVGSGKAKRVGASSITVSMTGKRASALTRACACLALLAVARNRSTKDWMRARSASARSAALSWWVARSMRRRTNSL